MKWLTRNRLEEFREHLNLIENRQIKMLEMLAQMGSQQGFKFKREKNLRRVESGKRSWAARKAREAEAAQTNGLLGLADRPKES